ncbi:MAG: FAD-dependent oxidoreductase [Actinomycetota bacterium]|nr:FAD-dependent oxidoreductase [Actinomycetota bacterium]
MRRGARTLLIERDRPGGECTFTGCVPSKALIEAAAQRRSFAEALVAMRSAVTAIAASEDAGALEHEGVELLSASARFVAPRTLAAGTRTVRARRVVLATGSAPALPPIPGLAESGYLTNESVFELERLPASLVVLGGGPVGCELAQAFARFGAEVHLVGSGEPVLSKEEPAASAVIAAALEGRRGGAPPWPPCQRGARHRRERRR